MQSILELATAICPITGATILSQSFATAPYKLLTVPNPPVNHCGYLYAMLMSASPGMLGGDTCTAKIKLNPDSALFFTTQAFNRILAMRKDKEARQKFTVLLTPGAKFHYLPHPTVLHHHANFNQYLQVNLTENNRALIGDMIIAGRVSRGEAYAFTDFYGKTTITLAQREVLEDCINWHPSTMRLGNIGHMQDFTHLLSLYYIDTAVILTADFINNLRTLITALHLPLEFGISQIHDSILALKAVAYSEETLTAVSTAVSRLYFTPANHKHEPV